MLAHLCFSRLHLFGGDFLQPAGACKAAAAALHGAVGCEGSWPGSHCVSILVLRQEMAQGRCHHLASIRHACTLTEISHLCLDLAEGLALTAQSNTAC